MVDRKNIEALMKAVDKAKDESEYRTSTIRKVKNLSRSDLDAAELYADFIKREDYSLMPPRGGVKDLLAAFHLSYDKPSWN